ncbi:assimilatory nitrate reductase electron transfer subunit [Streptomyces sp. WMMB 714]|uniref:NAD(P)/FAD-dependent oxidoreductase n=1 Tax=Streptomyces sp. WMMB 714 TaxID=1286822 RepID=UPI0005F813FD|nr:FAD-dependent oxidoreductase [Streptomyces sp. WMMB 714]SCK18773.1 assimilatory nitrate reductase electron transfer subunit [Streptomyces sp. WMMB 714]
MTFRQRVVVIGSGMAGARIAQQLDPRFDLTVVGEEPHIPYNRVLLAEVLGGQYGPEVIALPTRAAVRWMHGVRAVRVDRAERRVVCDEGSELPYDALVLATGSAPVLPPLRGLFGPGGNELPEGVRAFRTMEDCLALRGEVRPGSSAVVVGGGLLGVSAARALARRGARVVLAHQGERLMERQLDAGAAALLEQHLERWGVEVHTQCRVRGLHAKPHGRSRARTVRSAELSDGYRLDADRVVLACGVRPRVGLARAGGLEVARGVVVDDRLRTSDPRIYAVGDCAEHRGVLYGLAGPAQDQADTAARVIGAALTGSRGRGDGALPEYHGTRAPTRLTLGGVREGPAAGPDGPAHPPLDLAAFGEPEPGEDDDVVHLADATRGIYRKAVVRDDRLVGAVLLGDLSAVGTLTRTWEDDGALPAESLLHLLTPLPTEAR